MTLDELMEERMAFGKAHISKAFKELIPETKYLSWFAENYRHSQKPEHVKLLRFIQLHVESPESQMPVKPLPKAKAKSKFPPGTTEQPIDLEDDDDEVWEQVTEGSSLEMLQMQDRMNKMEMMIYEVLGHLNRQSQPQPDP